jgi:hypothetical protein
MLNRMGEIDVCHRTMNMKQRVGCVEKDDVDGSFHEVRTSSLWVNCSQLKNLKSTHALNYAIS